MTLKNNGDILMLPILIVEKACNLQAFEKFEVQGAQRSLLQVSEHVRLKAATQKFGDFQQPEYSHLGEVYS